MLSRRSTDFILLLQGQMLYAFGADPMRIAISEHPYRQAKPVKEFLFHFSNCSITLDFQQGRYMCLFNTPDRLINMYQILFSKGLARPGQTGINSTARKG